ncbi:MAG: copper amine oxidase N-terminal domain-containing protein [Defluviitaleaceae bacterium]|nr:copper amine oxidase N-terminal domain-containing protein [Defluviitaleaceae bacterium]MCL2240491.1 copper amine oxidase N-terminal domain-containing protein [Defluviitaleaceae bacterium]
MLLKILAVLVVLVAVFAFGDTAYAGRPTVARPYPDPPVSMLPDRMVHENLNFPVVRPAVFRGNLFEEQTDRSWLIIPGDFLVTTGEGLGAATITLPSYVFWTGNEAYGDLGGLTPVVFAQEDWDTVRATGNLARLQAISAPFTAYPGPGNEIRITFYEHHLTPTIPDPLPPNHNFNNPYFIILPLRADFTDAPVGLLQANIQVERRPEISHNTTIPVGVAAVRNLGPFTVGALPAAATRGPAPLNTWSISEGGRNDNFFATTTYTDPMRGFYITLGPGVGQFIFFEGFSIHFPNRGEDARLPVLANHEQGFLWAFNASRSPYHTSVVSFAQLLSMPSSAPERERFHSFFVDGAEPIISPVTGEILNLLRSRRRDENLNYAFLSHGGSRLNVVLAGDGLGTPVDNRPGSLQIENATIHTASFLGPASAVTVTATANNRGNMPNIPSATQNVFRFSPGGLSVTATAPTTVAAGLTMTPGFTSERIFAIEHLPGVTARLNIVETTPNSGFGPGSATTISLTDAEGRALEGVAIAGVQLGGNLITGGPTPLPTAGLVGLNRHLHNAEGSAGGGNARWLSTGTNAVIASGAAPLLSADSLTFGRLPHSTREQGLALAFRLSTAPNFSGPVYATVRIGENVIQTVRIANVVPPVEIVFTYRTVPATPLGLTPIGDITLRERVAGALRPGQLILALERPRLSGFMGFSTPTSANIRTTNGLAASLSTDAQGQSLIVNITAQSLGQPGEIIISDMNLVRFLPIETAVYISMGGPAIQDNAPDAHNARYAQRPLDARLLTIGSPTPAAIAAPAPVPAPAPPENGEGAPEAPPTPGPTPPPAPATNQPMPTVRLVTGSPIVRVGDTRHVLLVNMRGELTPVRSEQGRIFIPVRGIVPIFGGSYEFVWEDGLRVDINLNRTNVRFMDGSTIFYVNGRAEPPMSAAPAVFEGSLYVPARYFVEVFDMPMAWERIDGEMVLYLNAGG